MPPEIATAKKPDITEIIFHIGMWWRIIYGGFRIVLGATLLRFVGAPLSDIFYKLLEHELIEDPNDILIRLGDFFLIHSSLTISYFLAIYFIFWGSVDIGLSIGMLKHKLWTFPVGITLIVLFVAYEIYRFSHTHSLILAFIILVDIFLIWLIHKEYGRLRHHIIL